MADYSTVIIYLTYYIINLYKNQRLFSEKRKIIDLYIYCHLDLYIVLKNM